MIINYIYFYDTPVLFSFFGAYPSIFVFTIFISFEA